MSEVLAGKIKAMRRERGMSIKEFAELVDVHPAIISFIENGTRTASVRVAMKLAPVLDIGANELLQILNDSRTEREVA